MKKKKQIEGKLFPSRPRKVFQTQSCQNSTQAEVWLKDGQKKQQYFFQNQKKKSTSEESKQDETM